ncbi:pyruvate kinase [Neptunitalea lumnitzerae]|uniref:pyruvate kinase n=1 Tax=Neptunitalea lumnitzerae TaxID=2965509 RepID=A0ABQ5MMK7_9FLAO|nr:pyruvate kinase [Neptunitalea sp. Y10]GLB50626.1 pyruvate kinase [Neptunitalea sp. Y10]
MDKENIKFIEETQNALNTINEIIRLCYLEEEKYASHLQKLNSEYIYSGRNLLHYLVYRRYHSGELQSFLFKNGFSGQKNAEGNIMSSLIATKKLLALSLGQEVQLSTEPAVSLKMGQKILKKRTKSLLGDKKKKRHVRIMVTQPNTSAKDPNIVYDMMEKGMNTVRINCAHDDKDTWLQIINNTKTAMEKLDKKVTISMDLGGPKIRTGNITSGPKVVHLTPERDALGAVINPGVAILIKEGELFPDEEHNYIPVPEGMLNALDEGDVIKFYDTRDKTRELKVIEKENKLIWVHSYDSAYLQTGNELFIFKKNISFKIGEIPPLEQYIRLKKGDAIHIHKNRIDGLPAELDAEGNTLKPACISCTSQKVFNLVKKGEVILFDDGKISGIIEENTGDVLKVRITYAKESGAKLKADKGINFPESNLQLAGLTTKDKQDLDFVAKHADVVNMSFVNTATDVEDLLEALRNTHSDNEVGIILKIETMKGFKNIVKILLAAMQHKLVGVMIARGDLAVECGWENIGLVQKEMLRICHAAHIPAVWATQVMENLAKKGIPSRAEITDAVMAQHADCVMLNKGMYVNEAIELLDTILINIEKTRSDKRAFFKQIEDLEHP